MFGCNKWDQADEADSGGEFLRKFKNYCLNNVRFNKARSSNPHDIFVNKPFLLEHPGGFNISYIMTQNIFFVRNSIIMTFDTLFLRHVLYRITKCLFSKNIYYYDV